MYHFKFCNPVSIHLSLTLSICLSVSRNVARSGSALCTHRNIPNYLIATTISENFKFWDDDKFPGKEPPPAWRDFKRAAPPHPPIKLNHTKGITVYWSSSRLFLLFTRSTPRSSNNGGWNPPPPHPKIENQVAWFQANQRPVPAHCQLIQLRHCFSIKYNVFQIKRNICMYTGDSKGIVKGWCLVWMWGRVSTASGNRILKVVGRINGIMPLV